MPVTSLRTAVPPAGPVTPLKPLRVVNPVRAVWAALTVRPAVPAVLVPMLVMFGLGLWGLDRGSMWRDESATYQVASRSLPEIWQLTGSADAVHGLYYALMHAVLSVHPGEVALRLPSVCAAAVTAGLVAALGTRLARPRVGLWAGLLYAATPLTGYYAQEGRSYALVAAGAAAATLLLLHAVRHARVVDWCLYGVVITGTVLLHAVAALLLVAHAVTLLASWRRINGRIRWGWTIASCTALTAAAPLVWLAARQHGQVTWSEPPGGARALALLRDFAGPSELVVTAVLLLSCLALNAPLARGGRLSLNAVALPLALVPPAVLFAVSQRTPLYHDRYVFFALAGVPLLAAAGGERLVGVVRRVCRRGARRDVGAGAGAGRGVVVLLGVGVIAGAFAGQLPMHREDRTAAHRPDDLAAVARLAASRLKPGDPLLFMPTNGRLTALTYPAGFKGTKDVALVAGARESGTLYGQEAEPMEMRRRLAGLEHVWVLAEPYAVRPAWNPANATEQAKLTVVSEEFLLREEFPNRSGVLRHYVRRAPDKPIGWPPQ